MPKHCVCVCVCVWSTYIKLADSSIDSSVKSPIELHGERVGGLVSVWLDPIDESLELLHIVQHHLYAILHRVLHNLSKREREVSQQHSHTRGYVQ